MSSPVTADVTVVVPFYNASSTLDRALESVAAQTLPADRIVVVDDASRPEEHSAAQRIVNRYAGAELVTMPANGGPGEARNMGWDLARTRWVAFLDADDEWHPAKLERQLLAAQLAERSIVGAPSVICGVDWQGATSEEPWRALPDIPAFSPVTKANLLVRDQIPTSSVLIRTDVPLRFSPGRRLAEDHELWLRVATIGRRLIQVHENHSRQFKIGVGQAGLTANVGAMIRAEYGMFWRLVGDKTLTWAQGLYGLGWLTIRVTRRLALHTIRKAARTQRAGIPLTAAR